MNTPALRPQLESGIVELMKGGSHRLALQPTHKVLSSMLGISSKGRKKGSETSLSVGDLTELL